MLKSPAKLRFCHILPLIISIWKRKIQEKKEKKKNNKITQDKTIDDINNTNNRHTLLSTFSKKVSEFKERMKSK